MSTVPKIRIAPSVLIMFQEQIHTFRFKETGGILMGYFKDNIINIEKASGPGPKAIHKPDYFKADKNYVNLFIDMEYGNSEGKLQYIGEWHTHPQIIPEPSDLDLKSLSEIANSNGEFCLLLILGSIKFDLRNFKECSSGLLCLNQNIYRF